MMAEVIISSTPQTLCDWCGREAANRITVTLVSQYGAFRDDVCPPCALAYELKSEEPSQPQPA